jgi:hypothetical protein
VQSGHTVYGCCRRHSENCQFLTCTTQLAIIAIFKTIGEFNTEHNRASAEYDVLTQPSRPSGYGARRTGPTQRFRYHICEDDEYISGKLQRRVYGISAMKKVGEMKKIYARSLTTTANEA